MKKLFILVIISCFAVMAQAQTKKDILLKRAEAGDAVDQFLVSFNYKNGKEGFSQDEHEYLYWLRKAAENGYTDCQYSLAEYYKDKDEVEYLIWMRKAAENGYELAFQSLGFYYNGKDTNEAIHWLRAYADSKKGDKEFTDYERELLKKLGYKYKYNAKTSLTKKYPLDLANAEAGSAWAQLEVASHYHVGTKGYPEDKTKYIYWLRKSAENGNTKAQRYLAEHYEKGDCDLPQDNNEFLKWMTKAEKNYDNFASYKLGLYYLDKDKNKAISYFKKRKDINYILTGEKTDITCADKELIKLGINYDPSKTLANNTSKTTKKTTTTSSKSNSSAASGQKYHDAAIFDLKGNVKEVVYYNDGKESQKVQFTEDGANQNYFLSITRNTNGYIIWTKKSLMETTYKYDSRNRLIEVKKEASKGYEAFVDEETTSYIYDGNGNLIKYIIKNKNSTGYVNVTNIKNDSHGNWIYRILVGSKKVVQTRKITYWD